MKLRRGLKYPTARRWSAICRLFWVNKTWQTLAVAVLRWGQGAQAPKSCPALPPIFGHSSSATGWINWFYSKFRLDVVASQMMRGQLPSPKYFFLEPPLDIGETWTSKATKIYSPSSFKFKFKLLSLIFNSQISNTITSNRAERFFQQSS